LQVIGSAVEVLVGVLGIARAFAAATRAGHGTAEPAATLVERLMDAILETAAWAAAAVDPDLTVAIGDLDRALRDTAAPLQDLVGRCLEDPDGRYTTAQLGRPVIEYFMRDDELVAWVVFPDGPIGCL
jgi:hypothetical protein